MSLIAHHSAMMAGAGAVTLVDMRFEGANNSTVFTDQTGRIWTPSGAAKISTAWAASGLSSGYLDGTANTYITTPNTTEFQFGSGNFSIQFSARPAGSAAAMFVANWRGVNASDCAWLVQRTAAGLLGFSYGVGGVNAGFLSTGTMPLNARTDVRIERVGTSLRLYLNNVLDSTHTLVGALNWYTAEPIVIGAISVVAVPAGSNRYNGYIDDLTIAKG